MANLTPWNWGPPGVRGPAAPKWPFSGPSGPGWPFVTGTSRGMGESGGDIPKMYAGLKGYDFSQFYSDPCPHCGLIHRFYQHPAYDPSDGRIYSTYTCYALGQPGVAVRLEFAGWNIPVPQTVLTAMAQGRVIGS